MRKYIVFGFPFFIIVQIIGTDVSSYHIGGNLLFVRQLSVIINVERRCIAMVFHMPEESQIRFAGLHNTL